MWHLYRDPVTGWRLKGRGLPSYWVGTREAGIELISLMWETQSVPTLREMIQNQIGYLATIFQE